MIPARVVDQTVAEGARSGIGQARVGIAGRIIALAVEGIERLGLLAGETPVSPPLPPVGSGPGQPVPKISESPKQGPSSELVTFWIFGTGIVAASDHPVMGR
jgi:hypothetical protein